MTLERILLKGAILIVRLHLPTPFLKLTSFWKPITHYFNSISVSNQITRA